MNTRGDAGVAVELDHVVIAIAGGEIPRLAPLLNVKVREVIKMLTRDGWVLDRQTGSHRQYRHPTKAGTVTVPGNLGKEMKPGTLAAIQRQAGLKKEH